MRSRRHAGGFTLIELLITMAIIGVLSTAAIALFSNQQLRSKRAEGMTNVDALAKMGRAYYGDNGAFPSVIGSWPATVPAAAAEAWDGASSAAFGVLGFSAEGSVRYRYDFDGSVAECPCASNACFTAVAFSDLDADGLLGGVGYFHRDSFSVECPTTMFGWNAPTNPQSGIPIYDAAAPYPSGGGVPLGPDDY